jgi:hypothetical protein
MFTEEKTRMKREIISFETGLSEDEERLFFSAGVALLLFSLFIAHLFTRNLLWKFLGTEKVVDQESRIQREKVYNVLVEQDFKDKSVKDQIKALSDEDAAGSGGLTEKEGFHALSPFYQFILGNNMASSSPQQPAEDKKSKEDDVYEVGIFKSDPLVKNTPQVSNKARPSSQGQESMIPANYRFQQDFLFRWDGSRSISIPRKQLAGYHYFKSMLRKIESSFFPPGGGNFAYRDSAGLMIREGILPGESKVVFMLNDAGDVIDIKQVGSQGQEIVDRACLDSIKGQNFGPVPPEVKENGMIFGINFIFPGFRY